MATRRSCWSQRPVHWPDRARTGFRSNSLCLLTLAPEGRSPLHQAPSPSQTGFLPYEFQSCCKYVKDRQLALGAKAASPASPELVSQPALCRASERYPESEQLAPLKLPAAANVPLPV